MVINQGQYAYMVASEYKLDNDLAFLLVIATSVERLTESLHASNSQSTLQFHDHTQTHQLRFDSSWTSPELIRLIDAAE